MEGQQNVIASARRKPPIQFCGALGPVSPTSFARAAAPSMNAPNDLNESVRNALLDLERQQAGPGDAHVQAIVGLAARRIGGIVRRARFEADVPVFGRGDLRRVGLVAADKSCRGACRALAGSLTASRKCRTIGIR